MTFSVTVSQADKEYRIYPDNVNPLGAPFDGEDGYFFFQVEATPEAVYGIRYRFDWNYHRFRLICFCVDP